MTIIDGYNTQMGFDFQSIQAIDLLRILGETIF